MSGPGGSYSSDEDEYARALEGIDSFEIKSNNNISNARTNAPQPQIADHFASGQKLSSQVKRPSLHGADPSEDGYTPLSCFNTFLQDWVIKVKVNNKNKRNYKNARGDGVILSLDIMDRQNV